MAYGGEEAVKCRVHKSSLTETFYRFNVEICLPERG